MTEIIDAKYEEALSKIKTLLFAATSVSITTDAATMHTGDLYVTVTAHWLDAKWKMMSCVLGVAISNVSHTAEEIASLVKDLVNVEFMLENGLDSIGTDQGANFLAAVRLLIEEGVSEEQVVFENSVPYSEDFLDFIVSQSVPTKLKYGLLLEAGGQAARATEQRKHDENDAKCKELGWICVPMVVEAYGAWGTEAMESFSLLASRLATSSNRAKAMVLAALYGRLNLNLVRACLDELQIN
eukprot:Em0001g3056a